MPTPPHVLLKDESVQLMPWTACAATIHGALSLASASLGFPVTITCGTEGHGPMDPHTRGEARDVRVADRTPLQVLQLVAAIKFGLHQLTPGLEWTVLYEAPTKPEDPKLAEIWYPNPGATAAHVHIQMKKGTQYPPP